MKAKIWGGLMVDWFFLWSGICGTEDFRSVNKEEDPRSQIPDPVEMIWDLLGSDPRSVWNDGMNKVKVPYVWAQCTVPFKRILNYRFFYCSRFSKSIRSPWFVHFFSQTFHCTVDRPTSSLFPISHEKKRKRKIIVRVRCEIRWAFLRREK